MNHSGQTGINLALNVFIQLIIVISIFLAIFTYVQNIYTDDSFERSYIAKDIALALEAIQTPQGNTQLYYTKDTNSYTFLFEKDIIKVFNAVDQPQPPPFLIAASSFSVDESLGFKDSELKYTGAEVHPVLVKTNNQILAAMPGTDYNMKLYTSKKTDTSKEPKDLIFSTDSKDADFRRYVQAVVLNLNSALNTKFVFLEKSPDFIITDTPGLNIIYSPATKEKRKLANMIANRFLLQDYDIVILPSQNNVFVISIEEELQKTLQDILKDSFKEYYKDA